MKHESYDLVEFKADESAGGLGLFAAIVSVFNNIDRHGDRVVPGAFTKSIERWRKSGNPVPVVWSHEHKDPEAYIGSVDPENLKETPRGLVVAGQLDIENNTKAHRIYNLLSTGRLKQWSFAYEVKEERIAEDLARELVELDLFEVGPTLIGANAEAMTLAVKEAEVEAKAVDDSAWDANRAMGQCSSAADYRSICAGERSDGEPDQRQHWALPHHYLGRDANAAGVAAARQRFGQTEGLKNAGAARTHLFETHRLPSDEGSSSTEPELKLDKQVVEALARFDGDIDRLLEEKVGRVISSKTESKVRAAIAALSDILASLGEELPAEQASSPPEVKAEESKPPGENELLRLGLSEVGSFLAERGR
jgi:HK97 family phage prohead protease